MTAAAGRLAHLPRGHGEALTDAWGNMDAEIAMAVEARRAGTPLPDGLLPMTAARRGARGVKFIDAAADSSQANGVWTSIGRSTA